MKHNTILITGGSGYIGSHLVKRLCSEGYTVVVYDLVAPHQTLVRHLHYVYGDIRDGPSIQEAMERWGAQIVVHLAARGMMAVNTADRHEQESVNVAGTKSVIEAVAQSGCRRLVFASSAAVYGESDRPLTESSLLAPKSVYGKTKKIGEEMISDAIKARRISAATLRMFNVAGNNPDVLLRPATDKRQSLLTNAANAIRANTALVIYGRDYKTPDWSAVRDYVHIEDVIDATIRAMRFLMTTDKPIITNIGSGASTTNLAAARWMERFANRRLKLRFLPRRPSEIGQSVSDNTYAKNMLQWRPHQSDIQIITLSVCKHYGLA